MSSSTFNESCIYVCFQKLHLYHFKFTNGQDFDVLHVGTMYIKIWLHLLVDTLMDSFFFFLNAICLQ